MDGDGQLRNLRDFLLVYNRMTEICFQRCTNNFNYRTLTMDEERCVDNCAGKLIRSNHRLMGTYVKLMPAMVQRRMEEMESKAAEAAKANEAVGPGEPHVGASNSSVASSTDVTSTIAKPAPGLLTPSSAAEEAGTASINGTISSVPSPSTNVAPASSNPAEGAHKYSTEPSRNSSSDVTSPHLKGLNVSAPPAKT